MSLCRADLLFTVPPFNMNHLGNYNYYEANAADVNLDEITSSTDNKQCLQQLRDGTLEEISVRETGFYGFVVRTGDDLGWLGYFIGRCVSLASFYLYIEGSSSEERELQIIHALRDGIARNRSIKKVTVRNLCKNGFAAMAEVLRKKQLEKFQYTARNNGDMNTLNECKSIRTLLESGVRKLKSLSLCESNIGDAGVAAIARGLRSIGSSLEDLGLRNNSIGSEGLFTLAVTLANCTCLKMLDLSGNNFSTAAAGLRSLSDMLQLVVFTLDNLNLCGCQINDDGLQAFAEKATNQCKKMNLWGNNNVTASGWRHFSTLLQSESCCLEELDLRYTNIGDDVAGVLARALVNNRVLKLLQLPGDMRNHSISRAGWSAFSKLLCDNSTINNIYLSNHTVFQLWGRGGLGWNAATQMASLREELSEGLYDDLVLYLHLNKTYPQYAAMCKILMHYNHLDMTPLLQWDLKCLPLAIGWFERAKPCTTLLIHKYGSPTFVESDKVFESRVLTALFEFVRGTPKKVSDRRGEMILVATEQEKKRLYEDLKQRNRDIWQLERENKSLKEIIEQRNREISQLQEQNERLRGIVHADTHE